VRLLILGGTIFVGRHLTQAALEAGHDVTLFNRGQTNPELFPEVERIEGDRHRDLGRLKDYTWDAVLDTCGYTPEAVGSAAATLSGRCRHYTLISTLSVYQDSSQPGLTEESAVGQLPAGAKHEVNGETYGPLKALAEQAARSHFDGEVLVLRPGLIVGPYDPTERFTYWPRRLARHGEVLAPGEPERRVQYIDVRDLAAWTLTMVESGKSGTFNVTGPKQPLSMATFLAECAQAVDAEPAFTWVPERFLVEAGVAPFTGLPLWLPQELNGLLEVKVDKAFAAGLTCRSPAETAADTYAWDQQRGGPIHRGPGIDPARELALLQAWHAKNAS